VAKRDGPKRVALYTRVSTRHQAQHSGSDLQRRALERMAEQRGWTVVAVFDDQASGRSKDRPELARLMKLVHRGRVDVVAVWRFDRFARSVTHLVTALEEFRARRVDFVSHQEGLDTTTPIGMAMFQISAAFAELEHSLIRERVQAGVDAARARGVRVGRPPDALTPELAQQAMGEHGSLRKAATALGVSVGTLRRRLAAAA
jgi:DNA invertase Pin-like site-specific DNA recombinase